MEFDSTTFALEVINFLVLVWLLQRLLYKPVSQAIAGRRAGIEKALADARVVRSEADALKQQFENRMADWEREKALARQQLLQEMEAEHARQQAALQAALNDERDRVRALEQRGILEERQRLHQEARNEGGRFVARLLSRLASAGLEEGIRRVLLEDMPRLPDQELQALRVASRSGAARITSAYPLADAQRAGLVEALGQLAGEPVACEFEEDASLMAGLRISIGPWMLRSNLLDELPFFAGAGYGSAGR